MLDKMIEALDYNGDGKVSIEDIILFSVDKVPGVVVNREDFLRAELRRYHSQPEIEQAIATSPILSGISIDEIDQIANAVIKLETKFVTGISAALGAPGGPTMVVTVPADIVQVYGFTIRAMQKLLYLYGFPQLGSRDGSLDSDTLNQIIVCLGVMNGVTSANKGLSIMAAGLGKHVEKKLLKTAVNKTLLYPIVKKVAKWFEVNMTKAMFAGCVRKAIPVLGAFLGGTFTYYTFDKQCHRLKRSLHDLALDASNSTRASNDPREALDVEFKEL